MITIAIDGYSGCGKSTLAKAMAKALGYRFIDTGAMYRAVTLFFIRHKIDLEDQDGIASALKNIEIDFLNEDGKNQTLLNGENVEDEIRSLSVSNMVSPVATISAVRREMVNQQRRMGESGGVVMDGRDIGTVVFPNAELKIFVTAEVAVRVERRYQELVAKGKDITKAAVKANLLERDHIDSNRADSPLKQAEDAILLDNSKLGFQEFIDMGIALAKSALANKQDV